MEDALIETGLNCQEKVVVVGWIQLFILIEIPIYTIFFYKEPLHNEPSCRRPKYLKNLYYLKRNT